MRIQRLAQVSGGYEGDAIIGLRADAVLARGGEEQVDKRRIAGVTGAVGEGHGKAEGIADQNVSAAGQVGIGPGRQQAVITGHGGGG
ncbi:hypothetical protein D3C81_381210 [compost metagenome]